MSPVILPKYLIFYFQVPPSLSTKECFERADGAGLQNSAENLPEYGAPGLAGGITGHHAWWHGGSLTRASPLIGESPRAHYRFLDSKLSRGPDCPTHGLWVAGVRPGVYSEIMEIEE